MEFSIETATSIHSCSQAEKHQQNKGKQLNPIFASLSGMAFTPLSAAIIFRRSWKKDFSREF